MNNTTTRKSAITINKSCEKESHIRSEESLVKAVSVLKSLSNWAKEK